VVGGNLFGAPYDFRTIMLTNHMERYFVRLQELIEQATQQNRNKVVVVAHSIGCLLMYIFLVDYVSHEWKCKHIDSFISVGGPYGGSSLSLKTLISGLPKLSIFKERYFNVIQYSTGILLALPNVLGYQHEEPILSDVLHGKDYNLETYFQLLPDVTTHIWRNNVKPHIMSLTKDTGVRTVFVMASNHKTDLRYIYNGIDIQKQKEPIKIKLCYGDTVVPKRSLKFHARNRFMYPKYTMLDIPNSEHTKILHSAELTQIVLSHALM
jgi:hypothetical protein